MAIYDGSVVSVSSFAARARSGLSKTMSMMKNASRTRDNVSVIGGRKYVDRLDCGRGDKLTIFGRRMPQ